MERANYALLTQGVLGAEPSEGTFLSLQDWITVASAILALAALIVSILVAASQRRLAKRQELFAVTSDLFKGLQSPEFRERLTYIQRSLTRDSPIDETGDHRLSVKSLEKARPIMAYFNNVGLLVYHGAIDVSVVSSVMGGSAVSAWKVLAPYVYAQRRRRGDDPNYYAYFEHLAAMIAKNKPTQLATKLRLKRLPPEKVGGLNEVVPWN